MQENAVMEPPKKKNNRFQYIGDHVGFLGWAFLTPAVLYIVLLVGLPFVLAILFSMTDATVGDTSLDLVGFENYARIIKTPEFQQSLKNTFSFAIISQIIVIILANILAVILSADFRGKWWARMLIMLPWATPISLGAVGWLWLLDSKFSPIDWVLRYFGWLGTEGAIFGEANNIFYYGKAEIAQASIILIYVWRMLPLAAVILLAGLTSISQDILDQAEVDGSSYMRTLFQIKLPLILPIMVIALLFSFIFTVGDMTIVYVLTRGGPVYYTHVLPTWAFLKGIESGALAEGAAIALFIFPVLLAAAILILRYSRRTEVT